VYEVVEQPDGTIDVVVDYGGELGQYMEIVDFTPD
jgi:hypothetical protein